MHDPDVAYALARAYNNWIADFCAAAPDRLFAAAMVPLQNMDFALEELQRVAKLPCFRGAFLRPMFIEGRYFTHPYYDPLWAELERLGMTAAVHPTPGLWNPETPTARFSKKIRGRLHQAPLIGGGVGPFAGGGSGLQGGVLRWHGAARPSVGADSVLVGQSHVRRLDVDRLYGDAAVSQDEGGGGAR